MKIKNTFLFIIPTLNSYRQLPILVNSLIKQKYKNWRVIFIDGKSSLDHKEYLSKICKNNENFFWFNQDKNSKGIYGAMNTGLRKANENEWVFFWGSDDFPSSINFMHIINNLINEYNIKLKKFPDLLIFNASYVKEDLSFFKNSYFLSKENIDNLINNDFRRFLFYGYIPPHQATLFNMRTIKNFYYDENLKLAADLDYFLRLSRLNKINILTSNINIVNMINTGISSQRHFIRTKEVISCYFKQFGILFLLPLLSRYLKRFIRLLKL